MMVIVTLMGEDGGKGWTEQTVRIEGGGCAVVVCIRGGWLLDLKIFVCKMLRIYWLLLILAITWKIRIGGLVVVVEDPRSRLEGVFLHNISRPSHAVKLLGGPVSVDDDFSSALVMKRISKTIGILDAVAKINDPQCELLLIRACAGVSKLYFAMRTCPLSDSLRTKLLRHVGIVASGSTFEEALCVFNNAMGIDFLSNPTYLRVFVGDIYGDHAVSCAGIIGIKHHHNVVRDTLVDICFRAGISAGKEVDIGLDGGNDKKLRPVDMLLYSWDKGLDVCVDLTGSSPLTQTWMTDFATGRGCMMMHT
nr:reverse transcriptase domain-containing protein [Tanacetum cinerariifolium]